MEASETGGSPGPVDDVPGGPGWVVDGATLLPRITDLASFRAAGAKDPLLEAIELLWLGDPVAARAQLRGRKKSTRVLVFLADCDRAMGWYEASRIRYETLLREHEGDGWEPVLHDHLGKVLLQAGDPGAALRQFVTSLNLRRASGASAGLLAFSAQAVEYTVRLLRAPRRAAHRPPSAQNRRS